MMEEHDKGEVWTELPVFNGNKWQEYPQNPSLQINDRKRDNIGSGAKSPLFSSDGFKVPYTPAEWKDYMSSKQLSAPSELQNCGGSSSHLAHLSKNATMTSSALALNKKPPSQSETVNVIDPFSDGQQHKFTKSVPQRPPPPYSSSMLSSPRQENENDSKFATNNRRSPQQLHHNVGGQNANGLFCDQLLLPQDPQLKRQFQSQQDHQQQQQQHHQQHQQPQQQPQNQHQNDAAQQSQQQLRLHSPQNQLHHQEHLHHQLQSHEQLQLSQHHQEANLHKQHQDQEQQQILNIFLKNQQHGINETNKYTQHIHNLHNDINQHQQQNSNQSKFSQQQEQPLNEQIHNYQQHQEVKNQQQNDSKVIKQQQQQLFNQNSFHSPQINHQTQSVQNNTNPEINLDKQNFSGMQRDNTGKQTGQNGLFNCSNSFQNFQHQLYTKNASSNGIHQGFQMSQRFPWDSNQLPMNLLKDPLNDRLMFGDPSNINGLKHKSEGESLYGVVLKKKKKKAKKPVVETDTGVKSEGNNVTSMDTFPKDPESSSIQSCHIENSVPISENDVSKPTQKWCTSDSIDDAINAVIEKSREFEKNRLQFPLEDVKEEPGTVSTPSSCQDLQSTCISSPTSISIDPGYHAHCPGEAESNTKEKQSTETKNDDVHVNLDLNRINQAKVEQSPLKDLEKEFKKEEYFLSDTGSNQSTPLKDLPSLDFSTPKKDHEMKLKPELLLEDSNSMGTDFMSDMKIKTEPEMDPMDFMQEHLSKLHSVLTKEESSEELMDRLRNNVRMAIPRCNCRGPDYVVNEDEEGPYYTHLGAARSIQAIRELMEKRTGVTGKAIRIEKLRYTGKEGKSSQGCPIAKWIIRRSSKEEKYLCVVRPRAGHSCETACLIIVIVAWEGVPEDHANGLYDYLVSTVNKYGFETERRCGTNDTKTCACQGVDLTKRGASFSFGCSWSMYFNGCKFARSREAKKFKLKDTSKEEQLENRLQGLATHLAPLYKTVAPDAYTNQTKFENIAKDCRLGFEEGRPFSGVTACVDFCAHSHKDFHNMQNGSTVVVTLTKHRGLSKPDDEQLHVLPLYVMDLEDENGSHEAQLEKIRQGALEVLQQYPMEARTRSAPLTPSRRKKGKKDESPGQKKRGRKPASSLQNPNGSFVAEGFKAPFEGGVNRSDTSSIMHKFAGKSHLTYEDIMSYSSEPGFANMYDKFWGYYSSFGTFPPPSFLNEFFRVKKEVPMHTAVSSQGRQLPFTDHSQTQGSAQQSTPYSEGSFMNGSQSRMVVNNLSHISQSTGSEEHRQQSPMGTPTSGDLQPPRSQHFVNMHNNQNSYSSMNNGQFPFLPQNNRFGDPFAQSLPMENMMMKPGVGLPMGNFTSPQKNNGENVPESVIDESVIRCEMEYNEKAFHDPTMGGVAIALSHGAVLFEVAKRELHATTGLRNPDRFAPTRISLVFYQHKRLNFAHHGCYEYERKLEMARKERLQKVMEESAQGLLDPADPKLEMLLKKKKTKKEKIDITKTSATKYKYLWDTTVAYGQTLTTDSIITRWIDPQPMVTGPYQRWV